MHNTVEPLSDHPLFRALVLMGGALALGCGGVAQYDAPGSAPDAPNGGATSGAPGGGANSRGGSGIILGGNTAGATQTTAAGGGGGANAAALYNPACPYAQWNCNTLSIGNLCYFNLKSKDDPVAAGCTCDTTRPASAAACNVDEAFVCRQAFAPYVETQPGPPTWDGTLHIECKCVYAPAPSADSCAGICVNAFGGVGMTQCRMPSTSTCNDQGVCTATSEDVLRQDGVMCGCADIGLK